MCIQIGSPAFHSPVVLLSLILCAPIHDFTVVNSVEEVVKSGKEVAPEVIPNVVISHTKRDAWLLT